jgi:hypothetical protein
MTHKRYPLMTNIWRLRWLRHKAQAKHRGEPYEFTYQGWRAVWQASGKQDEMGRLSHQYTMVRIDPTQAWRPDNVKVIQRSQHHTRRETKYTKDSIEPNYILD